MGQEMGVMAQCRGQNQRIRKPQRILPAKMPRSERVLYGVQGKDLQLARLDQVLEKILLSPTRPGGIFRRAKDAGREPSGRLF